MRSWLADVAKYELVMSAGGIVFRYELRVRALDKSGKEISSSNILCKPVGSDFGNKFCEDHNVAALIKTTEAGGKEQTIASLTFKDGSKPPRNFACKDIADQDFPSSADMMNPILRCAEAQ